MSERELYYRRLPHWHPANATFFVTFRLEGSLPRSLTQQLQQEYLRAKQALEQTLPDQRTQALYDVYRQAHAQFEKALDRADGPRWLEHEQVAHIVQRELHALHPANYHLLAYCLMPTHVHLLVDTQGIAPPPPRKDGTQYTALGQAMWLLKGRTGYACQQILGQRGRFWSREYYDHVIRDEREYERVLVYIVNNPVKAGLVSNWRAWPYTYVAAEVLGFFPDL
ncbi:MAG: hypothetical protein DDG60_00690 [Anaerolineae bacterium]|nr:MAG: hypothetical protein DDG60_00690 [Anaerolineae bacterium]